MIIKNIVYGCTTPNRKTSTANTANFRYGKKELLYTSQPTTRPRRNQGGNEMF